ncbi:hypothetical protein [Nocardia brasiliensis]|uniref:hypothetical protein n=1 Tax=Nocardia brasiliensis TaxID=37326 RepID=UPI0018963005|nr:hypothetical protein [Nocardia brasiliensis]MBF6548840.1 hypothetical protein [Nocardia brasiliensis]
MTAELKEFLLAIGLIVMVSVVCGLVTAFLSWRGGAKPPNAALRGFAAFGGALTIGVLFYGLTIDLGSIPAQPRVQIITPLVPARTGEVAGR